jgi:hypothetical protein
MVQVLAGNPDVSPESNDSQTEQSNLSPPEERHRSNSNVSQTSRSSPLKSDEKLEDLSVQGSDYDLVESKSEIAQSTLVA